jgi:hypothetical protein
MLKSGHDFSMSFPLPSPLEKRGLDLEQEEHALRHWLGDQSNQEASISYEKFNLICEQIKLHDSREWKMDIGSGWSILRNGEILQLESTKCEQHIEMEWILESVHQGSDFENNESLDSSCVVLTLFMEKSTTGIPAHILLERVSDGGVGLRFLPPWRRGMKEVKAKAFLRGQKFPLHLRGAASFIGVEVNNVKHVAAIYVDSNGGNEGRWVIHGNFDSKKDLGEEVKLIVRRKSQSRPHALISNHFVP